MPASTKKLASWNAVVRQTGRVLTSFRPQGGTLSETFEKQPETGGDYKPLGAAELLDHDDRGLRMRAGSTTVEVAALAPDLFRVGMFSSGGPPSYDSEGVAKEDWGPVEVSMQESDEELTLSTTAAT